MMVESLFFKSLLTLENPFNSYNDILLWMEKRNNQVKVKIEKVPFSTLDKWVFDNKTLNLRHETGRFFSIDGLNIKKETDFVSQWCQPIINQPEVGYLGIITKEFNGILYFLMQAKIEPGNVNCVQLSPTLQATKSNYTQIHSGKVPLYLEYFQNASPNQILVDQLQSEQGARFFKKRNRNIIIKVNEEIPLYDDYCWLTLGQIKKLICLDNFVNMDSRTVISGITFSNQNLIQQNNLELFSAMGHELFVSSIIISGKNSLENIISWLSSLKSKSNLVVDHIPLNQVKKWIVSEDEIYHEENKFFKIIGVNVNIENREVKNWSQPIVEPMEHGICVFFIKKIFGIYHFLVQAKFECGNFDMYEFAPTIQCLQSELMNSSTENQLFIYELNNVKKENIILINQKKEVVFLKNKIEIW
jgi:oxidase EvaA